MKQVRFPFIILSLCIFVMFPINAEDLDLQTYLKIKEILSNSHHQEEGDVYKERIGKVTDVPLPYLIQIAQSKDNYVFIRARAIRLMELYQNPTSQVALEKTIEDTQENSHLRKLAINTYSRFSKIDPNRQTQFIKKFESDKELGTVVKNTKKTNLNPKPNQIDPNKLKQMNRN
ncbi:HEAT repeat domain-containing protein [Leptospira levettii]|uniref:HEAT repeat domain-containing protein n=1 Tax=Leptospira levettii TaxID=2023178 RepID=UPI0010843DBC|nr:HEAT repeat domain-containing protein [Leptospira levettii]TGM33957.1 HEAT repeat domain-containing protein [Leptospira levettii]TGM85396.1 HEAT repeat domain-containing protein [Leptospira levettii]